VNVLGLVAALAVSCRPDTPTATQPADLDAELDRADAHFDRGRYDEAATAYEALLGRPGAKATHAREYLLLCRAVAGRWDEAAELARAPGASGRSTRLGEALAVYRQRLGGAAGVEALLIGPIADVRELATDGHAPLPRAAMPSVTPSTLLTAARYWAAGTPLGEADFGTRQWTVLAVRPVAGDAEAPAASRLEPLCYPLDAGRWLVHSLPRAPDDPLGSLPDRMQAAIEGAGGPGPTPVTFCAAVRANSRQPFAARLWLVGTLHDGTFAAQRAGVDHGASTQVRPWRWPTSLPVERPVQNVTGP